MQIASFEFKLRKPFLFRAVKLWNGLTDYTEPESEVFKKMSAELNGKLCTIYLACDVIAIELIQDGEWLVSFVLR